MGNKQGHELSPEEKKKLKEEKEREKQFQKEQKERRKRERKELKKRKKKDAEKGDDKLKVGNEDAKSEGGSSQWSEKSQGSAPHSWYHSASEPSSRKSSVYLPAKAGHGYYQHDCWYSGYEDSGSEKSKPPSRAPSRASSTRDTSNIRAGSLERYPLGVPTAEAIEPSIQKSGSLDLTTAAAKEYLKEREKTQTQIDAEIIACRYDETIRLSKDHLDKVSIGSVGEKKTLIQRSAIVSSTYDATDELIFRGAKRKSDEAVTRLSGDDGSINKRVSLDRMSLTGSVTGSSVGGGSVYYSADEGGSNVGSIYYSATSGSGSETDERDEDNYLRAGIDNKIQFLVSFLFYISTIF